MLASLFYATDVQGKDKVQYNLVPILLQQLLEQDLKYQLTTLKTQAPNFSWVCSQSLPWINMTARKCRFEFRIVILFDWFPTNVS